MSDSGSDFDAPSEPRARRARTSTKSFKEWSSEEEDQDASMGEGGDDDWDGGSSPEAKPKKSTQKKKPPAKKAQSSDEDEEGDSDSPAAKKKPNKAAPKKATASATKQTKSAGSAAKATPKPKLKPSTAAKATTAKAAPKATPKPKPQPKPAAKKKTDSDSEENFGDGFGEEDSSVVVLSDDEGREERDGDGEGEGETEREGEGEGEVVEGGEGGEDGKAKEEAKKPKVRQPKERFSTVPIKTTSKGPTTFLIETDKDLDIEGDIGAVGRMYVEKDSKDPIKLDLKGYTFNGHLVSCNSFLIVKIGPTEAKVESVIDSYIDLTCVGNVMDKETVLEGHIEEDLDASIVHVGGGEWEEEGAGGEDEGADSDNWTPKLSGIKRKSTAPKASTKAPPKKKQKFLESADVAPTKPAKKAGPAKKKPKKPAAKPKASKAKK